MSFVKYSVLEVGIVEDTPSWIKQSQLSDTAVDALPVEESTVVAEISEDDSKGE